MNVSEAVATRRSTRAFLDRPVDRALIVGVLDKARFAPSGGNIQPWHGVVIGGDRLRDLSAAVRAKFAEKVFEPDYEIDPPTLPEPYRSRRGGAGEAMYQALAIAREDRAARVAHVSRNFSAWGAPVALFCHTPRLMGRPQWSDLGMWLQTIMLLLKEAGVDSCAQEAWSQQGATVRRFLDIPEDHILFSGMAIGYADPASPLNNYRAQRAPLEEIVRIEI